VGEVLKVGEEDRGQACDVEQGRQEGPVPLNSVPQGHPTHDDGNTYEADVHPNVAEETEAE
jgi:hypothetical protein